MPASFSGWRRPAWMVIAQPCEKPARMMRDAGTPRAFSRAMKASTSSCEARRPFSSSRRTSSAPVMSYQARIT
jgi:hypothetical protein